MKRFLNGFNWWATAAWAGAALALAGVALASTATATTLLLVGLFASLLLLVHLHWQEATQRTVEERDQTLALLSQTLETTADGFLLLDLEGNVVSFNRKLIEMSGLPEHTLRTGNMEGLLAWMLEQVENPEAVLSLLETVAADPEIETVDEIRVLDGRICERYSKPHRVGGKLAGRVWGFRDLTSERKALEALHRREKQLAEAQRIARLGSFDWNVVTGQIDVSEQLWRISGHEREAFAWTLERFLESVHPNDRERIREQLQRCAAHGENLECEVRYIRPDGSERYLVTTAQAVRSPDGAIGRVIGTAQDVTDRHRAAVALERRVRVERTLTGISQLITDSSELDLAEALRRLGVALCAGRVYLLQSRVARDRVTIERAEEWHAPGVSSAMGWVSQLRGQVPSWWMRQLRDHGRVLLHRLDDMPEEAAAERAIYEAHQVTSAAAVVIRDLRQGMNGLLGIEYCQEGQTASEDDLRALRTAGDMLVAHFARETAEREVAKRDAILEAVGFMAERFLLTSAWDRDLDDALERLGSAAGASRAYLFRNEIRADGEVCVSQRAEWAAHGVTPKLPNPDLQRVRLGDLGLEPWEETLRMNQPVQELTRTLSGKGRDILESQGIRSILLLPIFAGDSWWGFLGFDDRSTERAWSETEREALMTAGRMIGASIQRQRSETALRESELRFKQLAENIPEVFFMGDEEMAEVLYLSPSFEQVWGRPLEDAYTNPKLFFESILPEDLPPLRADMELRRASGNGAARFVDYRIKRPDGSIRWIRHRVFPIPDSGERPRRVAGVCTDITEQKQFEEEIRRANRLEAIGHLAAGIAHEINTPIQYVGDNLRFLDESYQDIRTALDAYQQMLAEAKGGIVRPETISRVAATLERAELDYLLDEAPRASAQALDGVQRVAEIVRAMKEFSHPGTGLRTPTDLNHAILSTITVARNEWRYVADLITDLDESLPPVLCLPGEINQAILNLLVNAAHAVADRQRTEGSDRPGKITIATAATTCWVEIRVSDTGSGIPGEIQPRIFDPFFTTKEVGRGTGQGLTFVHSIVVDKHGGTVSFDTMMGVGTTFVIRLPRSAEVVPIDTAA